MLGGHGDEHRRAIACDLTTGARAFEIVLSRHEDWAALRVMRQVGAGFLIEEEVVLLAPLDYLLPTALEHGDVECFNLRLLKHLGAGGGVLNRTRCKHTLGQRVRLALEPLER